MSGPEIEIVGGGADAACGELERLCASGELQRLCARTLARAGIADGHVAIEFVDEARIRELNGRHRGKDEPTDVLSFGIDESAPSHGPRELGDIVICPARTADIGEAVVHGTLHLLGMDHETDGGEMLALQEELLRPRAQR